MDVGGLMTCAHDGVPRIEPRRLGEHVLFTKAHRISGLVLPCREGFTDGRTHSAAASLSTEGARLIHDRYVRPARWSSLRGIERRRSFTPVCRDGLEKRIGRFVEFANFLRKVRTLRRIERDDRLVSRGVLTVPCHPDRYTAGDTEHFGYAPVSLVVRPIPAPSQVNTTAFLRTYPVRL